MPNMQLVPRSRPRSFDALQDFYLSKRSQLLAPRTLEFYERAAGGFNRFLMERAVHEPEQVSGRGARLLGGTENVGRHGPDARPRRQAFVRFLHREGYAPAPITLDMPSPRRDFSVNEDDFQEAHAAHGPVDRVSR